MNQKSAVKPSITKSLLDRLSQALLREPRDRAQLISLLREAEHRHLLDADALAMIEAILQFSELQARHIMIPRSQMVAINENLSLEHCVSIIIDSGHSRFPVLSANQDEVIGILHAKDMLKFSYDSEKKFTIREIVRPAVVIPESKKLDIQLKEFRENRNHMAIVVDEYGSIAGFITIEDIIEQIIGDIEDEFDIDEEAYIKKLNAKQFIIKAHTPIDEFNEYFDSEYQMDEYDTIAGLVINAFGYLPARKEKITIDQFEFEVLMSDNRRIRLLRLSKLH